jgi:hypothetical protein
MAKKSKKIKTPVPLPPPPPASPLTITKKYIGMSFNHSLIGETSERIEVGDKLVFQQIVTVREIRRTAGDKRTFVDVDKVTDTWEFKYK